MTPQERIVSIAKAQVGYREGPNNWNKFAEAMDLLDGYYNTLKQNAPWCDVFVDWCFVQLAGPEVGRCMIYQPMKSCGAGCMYSMQYFKTNGALYNVPAIGDQVFFGDVIAEHTGIVIEVRDGTITTVEGNSGDAVAIRSYSRSSSYILGYGRPKWSLAETAPEEEPEEDLPWELKEPGHTMKLVQAPVLQELDEGPEVAAMQALLRERGFTPVKSVKRDKTMDGYFGDGTLKQLKLFQSKNNLEPDGICGRDTWEALIKGEKR